MTLLSSFLLFAVGVFLLIKGADWLVEGASSLARSIGVSDLVIGLTVVSFGTSAPELIVNVIASVKGSADIAIGNILGSNISNTLLILGTTAIIAPLAIQRSTVLKEIPFSILTSIVLLIMVNDTIIDGSSLSQLSRSDGLVFLAFFVIFIYYTFGMKRVESDEYTEPKRSQLAAWGLVGGGLVGLATGGKFAVDTAQHIALSLGVSEALVGLTAVAIGTSLPELTASVVAALKQKPDISVGNIVGSNIFNILWILGISSAIKPLPFQPAQNIDLLVVVGTALLLFVSIHNGHLHHRLLLWWKQEKDYILNRAEGIFLLLSYVAYIVFVGFRG